MNSPGKIDKTNIEDILPLTPLQEGILFHYLKVPDSDQYFEQLSLRLIGKIDNQIFHRTWRKITEANEMLRTVYRWDKLEQPIQIVLKEYEIPIQEIDLTGANENIEILLEEIKSKDRHEKINITSHPCRIILCKISEDQYELIISNHHIIYDGWSNGILFKEFMEVYGVFTKGIEAKIPEKTKFKEFIKWCLEADQTNQKSFWKKYLEGFHTKTLLPAKGRPHPIQSSAGAYKINFPNELANKISSFVKVQKVTPATFLYSIWGILLQRYNDLDDIVFGITTSGRTAKIKGISDCVGLFINTLPLRIKSLPSMNAIDLLKSIEDSTENILTYENTSLIDIKSASELPVESLFDSIVVIENYPLEKYFAQKDYGFKIVSVTMHERTNFDLTIGVTLFDGIEIDFTYNEALFTQTQLEGIAAHFENVARQLVDFPERSIDALEILSSSDKHAILYDFNCNESPLDDTITLHELIERQAEKSPDAVALSCKQHHMTYRVLQQRSDRLAYRLRATGVKPDTIVGILIDNSIEMVIGIIGILKAGGAYLPIDPDNPANRIEYILTDSSTQLLLSRKKFVQGIDFQGSLILFEDEELWEANQPTLKNVNTANDLAYIIYTSGSTGKPKGVMVEHRNVVAYLHAFQAEFQLNASDVMLQQGTYCFDAFVEELYPALLVGGKVVIVPRTEVSDIKKLSKTINENQVSIISCSPLLINELNLLPLSDRIHTIISGGDVLKPEYISNLANKYRVYNSYGPTESTVCVTYQRFHQEQTGSIPIGKPIANYQAYILDKQLRVQPVGMPGELCVSGLGVTRGYLNKPELTAEKFIDNPYQKNRRIYKTGDLAQWRKDGSIEFHGRIDYQVKIRGYRIELGEIEIHLLKKPEITEAIVVGKKDTYGEPCICAYYVASQAVAVSELREFLKSFLPDYMIPAYYVPLASIPLTTTGKINTLALPLPFNKTDSPKDYVAPENDLERSLVKIWEDILGAERIGVNDNFFELGGHSLKAIKLCAKIHKELKVEIPIKEIFALPTIKGIAGFISGVLEEGNFDSIPIAGNRSYYPVSSAQKRMLVLWQLEKEQTVYNMPGFYIIEGKIDLTQFEKIFQQIIERHDILRTSFGYINEEPVQYLHPKVDFKLENWKENGIIGVSASQIDQIIPRLIKPFDLTQAPLLRVGAVKLADERFLFMVDMHHIISDGTSVEIVIDEFINLYQGKELTASRIQYKDYAVWQNEQKQKNKSLFQKQEQYWLKRFEGEIPVLNLPTDFPRPLIQSFAGNKIDFCFGQNIYPRLNQLALDHGSTLFMILLAGYNILLSKYAGQEDIILGFPVNGRPHQDLQNMIGLFVNTLAVRSQVISEKTFTQFLKEVTGDTLDALENQNYQFEDLIERLGVKRDISRNPLFDSMFILQNTERGNLAINGLTIMPYDFHNDISKFDLTLTANVNETGLDFSFEYSSVLFKQETVERMSRHYLKILEEIVADPKQKISEIQLLTLAERNEILGEFNNPPADIDELQTMSEKFETRADEAPDEVAVVFGDQNLTYRELNEKANQLARYLRRQGIKPDSIVGIMVERSLEMIIGILGILKAGGAYLPIDPEYPSDRIQFMLEDSEAKILLTQAPYLNKVYFANEIVNIDDPSLFMGPTSNLNPINKPEDLIYVIYTSGSTGRPKGVMIQHNSAINILSALEAKYPLLETDSYLLKTTFTFDVSVTEIFGWIFGKGKLVILEKDGHKDPRKIIHAIARLGITHINFVPSMFSIFTNVIDDGDQEALKNLKYIFLAGEALPREMVTRFQSKIKGVRLENLYGPTETTIYATGYSLSASFADDSIPIGKPLHNLKAYIVDKNNSLLPVGIPGELCVSGIGLARGYLKREELTREKFIEITTTAGNERVYKTGDLVKWRPDGNIEYLGRIDHQVKIRGFRIELGEIENWIAKYESIHEVVVIDKVDQQGDRFLCAYFVAQQPTPVAIIREYLAKNLPEYMIPGYFIQIPQMPLTHSGKIDRKLLPEPLEYVNASQSYVAPRNPTERTLVKIWEEVLNVKNIGIQNNFFDLGGHSLKATVLVSKIHKELNVDISLKDVFRFPTIQELAQLTDQSEKNIFPAILPSEKKEYYPLSSSQKRLFILDQLEGPSTTYNLPAAIVIEEGLDIPRLNEALNRLIKRHAILRTSYQMFNEEPIQRVHDEFHFQLESTPIGVEEVNDAIANFIQPFDLSKPSLIRAKVFILNNGNHLLLFDMHHIISDGVTMNVLLDEISRLYEGKGLWDISLQYYDYALWQNNLLTMNLTDKEEKYWLNELAGELPVLSLPLDYLRPAVQSFEGDRIFFELNESSATSLKRLASQNGATLFMLVLAVYNILLAKYSSQEDFIIGTPVAGRPHADLEKMVGMFVNTIVLRNYPQAGKSFTDFLAEVKNNALKAFENQNYQFDLLIEKLDLPRDLSRNPLFDVMLAFEDLDLDDVKLGGLKLTPYEFENKISKFDLLLYVFPKGKGIFFELEYNTALFTRATIEKMKVHFLQIIEKITVDPFTEIMNIDILTQTEKMKLLVEYNDYHLDFKNQKTIHQLFEEMAGQKPDYIAATMDGQSISYRQLNQKSNQMARMLKEGGAVNESVVGVMMDKSIETLISLMGILKAGAAYLPIDPSYPSERINHMLNDSGARILITNSPATKDASFTGLQNLSKDDSKIVTTPTREHLIQFDSLPIPDRKLIDISKYKNKIGMASASNCISLQTTRGCPYLCLFCHKVWSKKHVFRSAANIFNEIEYYYRKGVVNFSILDDCFNLNIDNGKRLFQMIIENGMKIQIFFPNGLRGDILTNDYIDLMAEAGVVNINLSLETASPRLQTLLKKHLNLDKFKKIMDYISTQHPNIILELATMHGFPTETEEEALMTLNFIKDIKWIHFPYIHILKVYPNTEIEELALANGVSKEDILKSVNLAYHEIPETLPFPKSFTRKYQAEFLNEYFLSESRLKQVLPVQMQILSEEALIDKYSAYLPTEIQSIQDIIDFAGIRDFKLQYENKPGQEASPTIFDSKFERRSNPNSAAKKILFLDLSQFFSSQSMLYKVYEQPLGQLYLLTYLKEKFGDLIDGRIYKSGVDFDSFDELKKLIEEYHPNLIGIRTLSFFKEFFHQAVSLIKQWGIQAPIITGGPYATSDYDFLLNDPGIDLVVFGEGELTMAELIDQMLQNDFKIPESHLLSNIKGIAFRETAPQNNRKVILMDDTSFLAPYPAENLNLNIGPENAAYVMYTSGSTGKPKGIVVEHQQVNNCIFWMQHEFPLQERNIVLQRTNLTFDPSVWEIFWTLSRGATIQLMTIDQGKDANYLIGLLKDNEEITMMYCPASLVTGMTYILTTIHDGAQERVRLKLPWLFIGAEPISAETVKTFYTYFEGKIVNTYGPTECTINNTYILLERNDDRPVIPIGKPVANNQIYILSNHLQLLPPGLPGEICIAGRSVARGYLNNAEKTSGNFLKNPFGAGSLYRTGDIGKWTGDGNIEISGRMDDQVKIRGYRIEIGEIESALKKNKIVKDCVAVVHDTKKKNQTLKVCKKCGLTSAYPDVQIDEDAICNICNSSIDYLGLASDYFRTLDDLDRLVREVNQVQDRKYDCLLLFAGGRGAAYALYQLVGRGYKVITATYDNGYFSRTEMANIKMITGKLNVEHVVLTHAKTEEILKESIKSAHTVCKGCFFTSSSLAFDFALKNNIKLVIGATLSRGQIIDNKLFKLLNQGTHEVAEIEKELANIQRLTYQMNEDIYDLIGINAIKDGTAYNQVKAIDFYRYCDVTNEEMINYLNQTDPYWVKRKNYSVYSTNCPIKQIGDLIHLNERGFHYYGNATSWEKRLGHIKYDNIKEDLQINVTQKALQNYYQKIKFEQRKKKENLETKFICAYIATEDDYNVSELREDLLNYLPEYMIPSYFVKMPRIPLTPEGKVNKKLLPEPDVNMIHTTQYEAPSNEVEGRMVDLWKEVLNIDKIGINDNFFELGGHSLKATILVSKMVKEFQTEIPLSAIFKTPTVKEISRKIDGPVKNVFSSIQPLAPRPYYPLSSAQRRMFILWQFEKEKTVYNMPVFYIIEGKFDPARFEKIFQEIIRRHEILRTSFDYLDGEPVQYVHQVVDFKLENWVDTGVTNVDIDQIGQYIPLFVKPFDLTQAPLIRIGMTQLEDGRFLLMVDMHHIISDGSSVAILIQEFSRLYHGQALPEMGIQYRDFAVWQNELLKTDVFQKQAEYWLNTFAGELPVLTLPTDYNRPTIQSFEGGNVEFTIGLELKEGLKKLALETGSTLYMVLLAVYNVLLGKYSGQQDIIVGSPIAGRHYSDLEPVIGMFVNTLAMRNHPEGTKSFKCFLGEVKENALKAYENQDYQFEELVEKLNLPRDLSRNSLFDTMFVLQNIDNGNTEIGDIKITSYPFTNQIAKFDLTLSASETAQGISLILEYCSKLFKSDTIERMAVHFTNLIKAALRDPDSQLTDLEILSPGERYQILTEFNNTKTSYPHDQTIQGLFEEQAARCPNQVAVVYEDAQFTYQELNEKANQVTRILKTKGIQTESIAGIMVDRSIEMLIGILGILKAGAAYLPVDPGYPEERIKFMLTDSDVSILLTQRHLLGQHDMGAYGPEAVTIDLDNHEMYHGASSNPPINSQPHNLAYIIYTSGSTGKPKGVMVEHQNVVRLVKETNYVKFNSGDRILQTGAIVFDASTFEFWGSLLNGLSLYIVAEEVILNPKMLRETLHKYQITTLWLTSPLFNQLSQQEPGLFTGLKQLLVGGDVLSPIHINRVRQHCPDLKIINGYGPTENTTFSLCFPIETDYEDKIPIGKPISNSTAYIVDNYGKLQPIRALGELWVGGDGVARGYLNRPELTAEKFIPDPFISVSNFVETAPPQVGIHEAPSQAPPLQQMYRMYRTGDLARWAPDGNVEFLGRIDQQVKIRGFRIEMEEIESRLLQHEAVKETVVIAHEDEEGVKYLCAYYVTVQDLTVNEIREYLVHELPDYMVPSYFIRLDKLPLTQNGKIDRKALLEIKADIDTGEKYVAPSNEIEESMVRIWKDILGIERIGIHDDFFTLGGHSLKITALSYRIRNEFNLEVPLRELFYRPSVKEIAEYIFMNRHASSSLAEDLVLLRKGSDPARNLFLIHDGSGEIDSYIGFSEGLDPSFQCWGIRFEKIANGPVNLSIEEIAAKYVGKIKKVQSQGPFYISGWSIGGTIAFEIARRLEAESQAIHFLGLIDSMGPDEAFSETNNRYFDRESELDILNTYLPQLLPKDLEPKTTYLDIWQSINAQLENDTQQLEIEKNLVPPEMARIIPNFDIISFKECLCYINVIRSLTRARASYIPQNKINAKISFFKASETDITNIQAWDPYSAAFVAKYAVPGDHLSIFSKPNLEKLINLFNRILMQGAESQEIDSVFV